MFPPGQPLNSADDPAYNPLDDPSSPQDSSLQSALDSLFKLYKPQHAFTDQLSQLISQFPQRQAHSKMQEFMANLASIHPSAMGISGGQPVGFMTDPAKFAVTKDQMLNGPFYDAMNDWQAKLKPTEAGAQDERYMNTNQRQLINNEAMRTIQAAREKDYGANIDSEIQRRLAQSANDKTKADAAATAAKARGVYHLVDPTNGLEYDVDPKTNVATPVQKAGLSTLQGGAPMIQETPAQIAKRKADEALAVQGAKNTGAMNVQRLRNQGASDVADKRAASQKELATLRNQIKFSEPTNQTKVMMEGAQMALPHVDDLVTQAKGIANRNGFGPVQSRLREAAAKLGTTGTPEDVQRSLDEFANKITSDPALTDDFAVGQFTSNLAFMASLFGRIHGGARGGSSIQMVNYLKSVLSGSGSFDDFLGRVSTLQNYLKGYAAGPHTPTNDDFDKAIDKVLGGK